MNRLLVTILFTMLLAGCTASEPAPPAHRTTSPSDPLNLSQQEKIKIGLTTEKVATKTLPVVIDSTGIVRSNPNMITPVISLVPGRIEEVLVQQGDQVKRGDVLARALQEVQACIRAVTECLIGVVILARELAYARPLKTRRCKRAILAQGHCAVFDKWLDQSTVLQARGTQGRPLEILD